MYLFTHLIETIASSLLDVTSFVGEPDEFEIELDSSRQQITELEMDLQMLRGASNRRQTLPAGTFSGMGNVH